MLTRRLSHQLISWFVLVLGGLLTLASPAAAQRALPDPAPLNNFNPLCDSSLVHCLEIDSFAGHVYGHLQVLPKTDRRDTAAVFPLGVTLGLFGRVAGGISTYYAFWREDDATFQQLGPLRLSLIGRLLPLFSSTDAAEGPTRSFQLGLAYEHEVRVGPFSGSNSLGLLTNLASLHVIGSKWLGPFQLSGSVGALFDWQGNFATGSLSGQFGWLIPGFKQLKVFVQGTARGIPAYAKSGALPLIPNGQDPIHPQGIVGGGLAFRVHRRVDLGAEVQRGFGGGIAPWSIGVNFLVISGGKEHEGRAVTPLAQLAADVTREFASWVAKKIETIDPYLKKDCVLYDDNHQPMTKLGELAPDGKACIYQGLRVPIGPHFWKNQGETRVCYDKAATDCFLTRADRHSAWEPIHPLLVHNDCYAYLNGQPWMRVGKLSADRQRCENQGQAIPVGQTLKPDHSLSAGWYCYDETNKEQPRRKHHWCIERPERPQLDGIKSLAQGATQEIESLKNTVGKVEQAGKEMDQGTPWHATTPAKEAQQAAENAIDGAKNMTLDDAERIFNGLVDATRQWSEKPAHEIANDILHGVGGAAVSPATYLPVPGASMLSKGGKLVVEGVVKGAEDLAKVGKRVKQAVKAEKRAVRTAAAAHPAPPHHAPQAKPPHGNLVDDRPATLYVKVDEKKELLKHGITKHEDPRKRYTRKEIGDGDVIRVDRGPRREMVKKERELVETTPGPDNHEPWAGKRKN